MSEKPWYKDGLRFGCTACGQCCTGTPGYVWLKLADITAIAKQLGLSQDEVILRYTRVVGGRLTLLENPHNFDCVFLKERRCTIYEARPKQCRTFPWWKDNLASQEEWELVKQRCEGIEHPDARLYSLEEIQNASK